MQDMQKTIQKIIDSNKKKTSETAALYQDITKENQAKNFMAKMFGSIVGWFAQNILRVEIINPQKSMRVLNFPKEQKTKDNSTKQAIDAMSQNVKQVETAVREQKVEFPEVQKIDGVVEVKNQVEIPEVKIPEYPKQIKTDVISLPKYVSEKLDKVNDAIKGLKLNPSINVRQPEIKVDINQLSKDLKDVKDVIKSIDVKPEVNVDLQSVIQACKETTNAIQSLKFPIPNVKSSWSHSLSMQSEDLGKTYTWTVDGGKDVVETITFTADNGVAYRKTYTYDGTGKISAETSWEEV